MKLTLKQLKQLIKEAVDGAYDSNAAMAARYAKGWHIIENDGIDKKVYATKEEALAAIPDQRRKNAYSGGSTMVVGVALLSEFVPAPEDTTQGR